MAERKTNTAEPSTADREFVVSRLVDAPRELVWEAWTDPRQVAKWWGPVGFSTTITKMDVRPGGEWIHTMHGPDGTDYPNHGEFIEVVRPERIVYRHGNRKTGDDGISAIATWTFVERGGKTEVTIRMVFPTPAARDKVVKQHNAVEGGKQTLGRLAEYMLARNAAPEVISGAGTAPASSTEGDFVITRLLDAPRDLVWKAWTEEKHLMGWFGPKGFTMLKGKLDLQAGGVFHYGMRTPDGKDMWGKWTFLEIMPPERLVMVSAFSDAEGGITRHPFAPDWPLETLSIMTLAEDGGKTMLTLRWQPLSPTPAERKAFDAGHSSMRQGWSGTFEQLEAYLAEAKRGGR